MREIRMPDYEPIKGWRMMLVLTESNEVIVDRVGVDDHEMMAVLQQTFAMVRDRQG